MRRQAPPAVWVAGLALLTTAGAPAATPLVPEAVVGEWRHDTTDCRSDTDDSVLMITQTEVRFWASAGPITAVTRHATGEISITARVSEQGETSLATWRFRLSSDNMALADVTDPVGEPFVRRRCQGPHVVVFEGVRPRPPYEGPPVIVPSPPPPPAFTAAPPGSRREYTGPPVILPGPPPPPAPPVPPGSRPITNPQWLLKPTTADFTRLYPPRAREHGVSGRATLECRVRGQGTLTACSVLSESPAGMGFGEATLRIAAKFRMRPRTTDGHPVEGRRVRVAVVWNPG